MEFRGFARFVFVIRFVSALSPIRFIDSNTTAPETNPLCRMGCKCPEAGQAMMLLDCSKQDIRRLPSSIHFESFLTSVNLQGNNIISLSMSTFSIADSIEELDMSVNQISRIDNFTFTPFKSLTALRLSHNQLHEIGSGLLEGLRNLRVLELGHNTIQRLSPSVFQGVPNLLELRLQYNPLFELHENLFQLLPKLQRLDLEDTGLVALPWDIFKPIPRLEWLSLANNAFENVPEEALSYAPILESLDLSGNDFTNLVAGNFKHLSNISLLYLNNLSKLTQIQKDAFAGLRRLKTFSCSFNPKLVYIDEDAFGSENSTISKGKTAPREQIYLRQNALRTLKSPLKMESWSSLDFVDLADNPWKCDCNLLWMRKLKTETQMNIVCSSPPHLKGRPFSTVSGSELRCQDKWALATFILTISAMVGFGLVILAASAIVCSRTPAGLYVRAKKQFSYAKVDPKSETVDLEWDPSAET